MHVAVIGAGIIGTLTAHYLDALGVQVTVLERHAKAAAETSRANGGPLPYSFCDALADPQILPKLPSILAGLDPGFRIKPPTDWEFIQWGCRFLSECTAKKRDANTLNILATALHSAELMAPLLHKFGDNASHTTPGKLVLLSQPASPELTRRTELKRASGVAINIVSNDEMLEIEPQLKFWDWHPHAAIYAPGDEVADAFRFTQLLASDLQARGVEFRFNTPVESIQQTRSGECVLTSFGQTQHYDAVVIAAGHDTMLLTSLFDSRLPVIPMAGYSLTLPSGVHSMRASITAQDHRIVFSRLGARVRIAGFADMNPRRGDCEAARTALLMATAERLAPEAADYRSTNIQSWQGFRGMTPNSRPLVGPTRNPKVFVNIGHGMLGWTLGAATAWKVATQVIKAAD